MMKLKTASGETRYRCAHFQCDFYAHRDPAPHWSGFCCGCCKQRLDGTPNAREHGENCEKISADHFAVDSAPALEDSARKAIQKFIGQEVGRGTDDQIQQLQPPLEPEDVLGDPAEARDTTDQPVPLKYDSDNQAAPWPPFTKVTAQAIAHSKTTQGTWTAVRQAQPPLSLTISQGSSAALASPPGLFDGLARIDNAAEWAQSCDHFVRLRS